VSLWKRFKPKLEAAEHLHFFETILEAAFGWRSWLIGASGGVVMLFVAAADPANWSVTQVLIYALGVTVLTAVLVMVIIVAWRMWNAPIAPVPVAAFDGPATTSAEVNHQRVDVGDSLIEPQFNSSRDIHRNAVLYAMGQQLPNKATYVQIQVVSVAHADDCEGYLTQIERLDAAGNLTSLSMGGSRSLKWSPQEQDRILVPIDPHIPQCLDIFRVVEDVNRIEPLIVGGYPASWVAFLDQPGVYRMTIAVTAKGTRSRSIRLRIDWKGRWSDFDVGLA
jgi:hypothetical protein